MFSNNAVLTYVTLSACVHLRWPVVNTIPSPQNFFHASFLLYSHPSTSIIQCLSAYYGAVYGMQVVGNWLSCPWHWAPERRKLHHTHYCANICTTEEMHRIRGQTKTFHQISLFTPTEVLTAQVSTVYSKVQRCKRFGGHNFPTWKKIKKSSVKYCLLSISSRPSYCQELGSKLLLSKRSSANIWHSGNPLIFLNQPWKHLNKYFSSQPSHQFQCYEQDELTDSKS